MYSGLWAANALALSYASSTFGGFPQETRAVSLALVNGMGNLASIVSVTDQLLLDLSHLIDS